MIRDRRETLKQETEIKTDSSLNNNIQEEKYDEPSNT